MAMFYEWVDFVTCRRQPNRVKSMEERLDT
jgi:hypothetical protein